MRLHRSEHENTATLLYHTGALGDFIATIPAIDYWKKRNKQEKLVMLGGPAIGAFAFEMGIVDEFLDVNKSQYAMLFSDFFKPEIAEFFARFSQAIVFAESDSRFVINLQESRIPCLHQPPFPQNRMHVVDYHLSLLADVSKLSETEKTPRLALLSDPTTGPGLSNAPQPGFIAIHPGSGSPKKNWPFGNFLSVAGYFRGSGRSIVWIKGPAESYSGIPEADFLFADQSLMELANLVNRCDLFIGNDSGVAHLAAALGCKTTVLFGPSDPYNWAARGKNVKMVYKNKPCSPCHRINLQRPLCDASCLTEISANEVLAVCQSLA
jgi:ADP-heptose:LPS heptosyltransferase